MPFFVLGGSVEIKMGHTALTCHKCGTVTAVENEVLEAMRDYTCPVCGVQITRFQV